MPLTHPLFATTTALALMAGLACPALAQSPTDATPRELLDAARKGELDLGFDTTTLSREQLVEEIARAKALCEGEGDPGALACDRIAQLPDPSGWLAATEPVDAIAETDEAGGSIPAETMPTEAPAAEPATGVAETPALETAADSAADQTAAPETPQDGVDALAGQLAEEGAPPADEAEAQMPLPAGAPRAETTAEAAALEAEAKAKALEDALAKETPQPDAAADTAAQDLATAEPASEPTTAEQAGIAAQIAAQGSGSAAANASGTDGAELIEEQLTDKNTRSSAEDFATRIGAAKSSDEKGDNDTAKTLGAAALLGLGAVALNQILGENAKVVEDSGDRIVVEQDGQYRVLRNDDVLLRQPGADVKTYRYDDGSTRAVIARENGATVETIKAADGRVLRRTRTLPNGETVVLFDDTQAETEVVINDLPQVVDTPTRRIQVDEVSEDQLAAALAAQSDTPVDRRFSLNQIRNIDAVRHLVPEVSVDSINFETGSAAIRPEEARALSTLGNAMKRAIAANPTEVFLIEGHTDATGGWGMNLALSDRRAESVALALSEYFDVPPENMVLQGYGESDLAIETQLSERQNRRAAVRRITSLLQGG